ncbi:SusC/RagA family TonB-linked outer membrane protein [Limibacterium fermenti]|uniref:SusC/RagA family TonB-linked outer membrane protein n=1 Tax=Limibacterium fermenti TaxID=3229863 RepID=UPI003A72F6D6
MKVKKFLLFVLYCVPFFLFAQEQITVKGVVTESASGQPAIGVSVLVKGSSNGTVTDIDGNYTLTNVPDNATLVFSYIGMLTQEVNVGGRSTVNVTLAEDVQALEEVVVIGYGSAKSKDLTAPIDVIKEKDFVNVPTSSPMAALQGKVPGVNIINSGTPGDGPKVTIRGMGSFGDTSPLYVVDGMFYDNINFLNNSDVQEMTVLKDASAAAIYGVRAANGVVIITTKKGVRNQEARVTYNGYVGIQQATNLLQMANSHEYATMLMEAAPDTYRYLFEGSVDAFGGDLSALRFNADTDWYNELLRTAMMTNHSLNVSGGTDKATYSTGLSYLSQDGVMDIENYYRRLNFRAALDFDARSWLKIGFNGVFSNSQQQMPKQDAWQHAFNTPSIIPVYDESRDSSIFPHKFASPEQVGFSNNFYNPVATATYYDNRNETYQVLSNFYAQFNILPDKLNVRSSYSYDYSQIRGTNFTPTYYVGSKEQANVTSLTKKDENYYKGIWDNTATYTDKWGRHAFTGMAGVSMRQEQYKKLEGTATNVPEGSDVWKYIALGNKEGATVTDDGWRYRGLSYFTRLNYNYDDKYMLMLTYRADGSSKYNDQWGYFPSIGAAWVVSQEPFMKDQKVFDYLKLRTSWGKLGNDKIAASAGFASIENVQAVFGPNNALDGYTNSSNFSWLGWEVVNETNIGASFSTLRNRLNADIDWYYRITENAVISPKIPMQGTTLAGNYGEILNTGVDLSLNWNDNIGKDFAYNVGANLSFLHNEVKSLKDNMTIIKGGKTVNKVGEKMNSYYGFKVVGVYQTAEEVQADPIAVANGLEPGDFKYEDVNNDNVIDGSDKQILGSYIPDLTYGFNVGFAYKNLDFGLTTYGQLGGELWNRKRALRYAASNYNFDKNQYNNRWTGAGSTNENPSSKALLKTWNVSDSNSASYFVEKSDYFRIQNVTLGYSFRDIRMGGYTLPGVRLSLTADRPLTWFKANSFTPELSDAEGWDTQVYPLTATYTFGVQIDF